MRLGADDRADVTTLYTIGFTQSTAERFFGRLRDAGVRQLLDIRLHNTSQLAAFSKHPDLAYFLDEILDVGYDHRTDLAPTPQLLTAYKTGVVDWDTYAADYEALLDQRQVEGTDPAPFRGPTVLLCSEATPEHCHRRVAAEYLARQWTGIDIQHL